MWWTVNFGVCFFKRRGCQVIRAATACHDLADPWRCGSVWHAFSWWRDGQRAEDSKGPIVPYRFERTIQLSSNKTNTTLHATKFFGICLIAVPASSWKQESKSSVVWARGRNILLQAFAYMAQNHSTMTLVRRFGGDNFGAYQCICLLCLQSHPTDRPTFFNSRGARCMLHCYISKPEQTVLLASPTFSPLLSLSLKVWVMTKTWISLQMVGEVPQEYIFISSHLCTCCCTIPHTSQQLWGHPATGGQTRPWEIAYTT